VLILDIMVEVDSMPGFDSEIISSQVYIAGTTTNLPVTLPSATGGNETLRYSLTPALPNGLSFNAATRMISGIPTTTMSNTEYTYTVTDEDGDMDELTFGITVETDSIPGFDGTTIDSKEYVTDTAVTETLPDATGEGMEH